MFAVTVESILLVLLIVGVAVGLGTYRVLLAKRRVSQWKKGHGPGHESFIEIPHKRDVVFPMAGEILASEYTVTTVARVERMLLGEKASGKRTERVTVRVAPTLEGCEVIFVRLGPGWKSMPAGTNGPEAERFFSALLARLGLGAPQQLQPPAADPGAHPAQLAHAPQQPYQGGAPSGGYPSH